MPHSPISVTFGVSPLAIMFVREGASVGGRGSTAWFVAMWHVFFDFNSAVTCVFFNFFTFSFDDTQEIASDSVARGDIHF
jgi:hypothetical protein